MDAASAPSPMRAHQGHQAAQTVRRQRMTNEISSAPSLLGRMRRVTLALAGLAVVSAGGVLRSAPVTGVCSDPAAQESGVRRG